jgi:hypothetical protein
MTSKKTRLVLALLAAMLMADSGFAACVRPQEPEIPSGSSASGADMLKAKKAVEAYIAEVDEYLKCGLDITMQRIAVDGMEKIASRYNEELRTYKAKS